MKSPQNQVGYHTNHFISIIITKYKFYPKIQIFYDSRIKINKNGMNRNFIELLNIQ
jgi:hypothetical protein